MDVDGNLAALAKYEKEQDANERRYDMFVAAVLDDLHLDYEDLRNRYDYIAEQFDYDVSFEDFVKENI